MGVVYAQGSELARLEPVELSERLAAVLEEAAAWLGGLSDAEASRPEGEGKWSVKQVVGHLTDSALNNIGRVMRFQIASGQVLQGYEQDAWVRLQHYQERDWAAVLGLWWALNEQMTWIVRHIEKASLGRVSTVEGDELTLGFLIEDYIAHMEHHLRALRGWSN